MKFTDDYDFETLTVPTILVGFPLAVGLAMLGFSVHSVLGITVLGVEVLAFLLVPTAAVIRDAGKKLEVKLFPEMPTTTSLRAQQSGKDKLRERRRSLVSELSGIQLLSYSKARHHLDEEKKVIGTAIGVLREKMRSKKFKILRRELKSYGYWRNVVAIKVVGIITSTTGALVVLSSFVVMPINNVADMTTRIVCLGTTFLFLAFWLWVVRQGTAVRAANNYSEQFFKSLTLIGK